MNILETPITVFDGVISTNGRVTSLVEFLNDASSHQLISTNPNDRGQSRAHPTEVRPAMRYRFSNLPRRTEG